MAYNGQGFSEMLWGNNQISNDTKNQLQQLMQAILGTREGSADYNQRVVDMNQVIYGDQFTDWNARDALAAFFPAIANNGYRVTADDARGGSWDRPYVPPQSGTTGGGGTPATIPAADGAGMKNIKSAGTSSNPQGTHQNMPGPDGTNMGAPSANNRAAFDQAGDLSGGYSSLMDLFRSMMSGQGMTQPQYDTSQSDPNTFYNDTYTDQKWTDQIKKAQDAIRASYEQANPGPSAYEQGVGDFNKDRKQQILGGPRGRETQYWLQNKPQLAEDNPFLQDYIKKYQEGGK